MLRSVLQALVPEQVSDVSRALSWVMDHIDEFGGDPKRISFCGHSSGGVKVVKCSDKDSSVHHYSMQSDTA